MLYNNSPQMFSPNNNNSKYVKYFKNKNSYSNKEILINNKINNLNNKKVSNLNSYKIGSPPQTLKHSVEYKYNILNNSPISSKTTNINNQYERNLKLLRHNHDSFTNKNKLSTIISNKDKLNNSLYTTNSRMNKSTKNFYHSGKFDIMNNNKMSDKYNINKKNILNDSFENNFNSSNYKNITIKNVFNNPSINKNNHYIKMTNNNIRNINTKSNDNFINTNINNINSINNINKINRNNTNYTNLNSKYINNMLSVKDYVINQQKNKIIDLNKKLYENEEQMNSVFNDNNNINKNNNINDNIASINFKLNKLNDNLKKVENIPLLEYKNQELIDENLRLNKKITNLLNDKNNIQKN